MEPDKVLELVAIVKKVNDENLYQFKHYKNHLHFKRQAFISFGTFMLTMSSGATLGFSAILIPQLEQEGNGKYSTEIVSWVASIPSLALVLGNIISGYFMDKFGRRKAQLSLASLFMCGWIVIALSNDILTFILIGRFITGLCQGWLGALGPIFVAEISSPNHRGLFLGALSFAISAGVFMSHLLGTFLQWKTCAMFCGALSVIGFAIIYQAPESPSWFASKNRIDDCVKSFYWYRGTNKEMTAELDGLLLKAMNTDKSQGKYQTLTKNMKRPEFWKPLFIMIIFFVVSQLTGVNVICAYTTFMVNGLIATSKISDTYITMLSIDVIRCVSLVVACILLKTSGRRPLAMFSGIFTFSSLISLALYLYLVEIGSIKYLSSIVTLGLFGTYIFFSNLGISSLPWNMVGEVFANETKGLGSAISVMTTSVAYFVILKMAPFMLKSIGPHGTYLFFGMSTLLGTVFLYFCLPETKGKTLLEIEDNFRRGN